jgi:hypothetical protein
MAAYLTLLSVILLAMVAGLLMALWAQLRDWRKANREAPLLAEQLAEQMLAARNGLNGLKQSLTAEAPELNRLLSEGAQLRLDLQFLLQRCEQLAQKLEQMSAQNVVVSKRYEVEQVAGANGQAIGQNLTKAEPQGTKQDPLEELLAGLQQATVATNVTPISTARRKRSGPVTQAELDLQQKIGRR